MSDTFRIMVYEAKKNVLIKGLILIVCLFMLSFASACSRYHPTLLMKFSQAGMGISVKKLVEGSSPSWSPDGKELVYQDRGIWTIVPETKKRIKIASEGKNPAWSPDGEKIAYEHEGIWLYDRLSGAHRKIADQGGNPCWLQDGASIAFAYQGIWKMEIEGEIKERLLDSGIPHSFLPGKDILLIETWDSENLSFELELFNITTLEIRGFGNGTKGSFSPSGEYIIYSKDGIWLYSFSDRASTRVIIDGYDPKWSPKGDLIAFCANGTIWIMEAPYL